jgi:hypothetical protein
MHAIDSLHACYILYACMLICTTLFWWMHILYACMLYTLLFFHAIYAIMYANLHDSLQVDAYTLQHAMYAIIISCYLLYYVCYTLYACMLYTLLCMHAIYAIMYADLHDSLQVDASIRYACMTVVCHMLLCMLCCLLYSCTFTQLSLYRRFKARGRRM